MTVYLSDDALLSLSSMEGEAVPYAPARRRESKLATAGALGLAAALALAAYGMHYLPFAPFAVHGPGGVRRPISAAVIAILLGMLVRNLLHPPEWAINGSRTVVRRCLPALIILAGAGLDLSRVTAVGPRAILIALICITAATVSALYAGNLFGLARRPSLLIGAGTAICGTSAILALAPTFEAEDDEITISAATVNLLGLALMFVIPFAGGLLHMSDDAVGVWAGTSVHAVPQAVAAGFAFSTHAGTLATLVKLMRVALLAPYAILVTMVYRKLQPLAKKRLHRPAIQSVPGFLWGFVAVALLASANVLPTLQFAPAWMAAGATYSVPLRNVCSEASNVLLAVAMAGLGLEVGLRSIARVGRASVLTGLGCTGVVSLLSWALVMLLI